MTETGDPSPTKSPPDGDRNADASPAGSGSLSPTSTVDSVLDTVRNRARPDHPTVRFSYGENHPTAPQEVDSTAPAAAAQNKRRHRGYSLRRSLFAQNIQQRTSEHETPIELKRPRSADKTKTQQSGGVITVAETEVSGKYGDLPHRRRNLRSLLGKPFSELAALPSRVDKLFERKSLPASADGRHVRVTDTYSQPLIDGRTGKPYIDNTIVSCRYTPWNFFPRQLIAQFSKLANFYFLLIAILQMIPGLSTTGQYTTIVPLLIFVLISMAKEGYDDLRRHRLDKEDNLREVDVLSHRQPTEVPDEDADHGFSYPETLSMRWRTKKWQELTVGDVILLERDEPVPADVVVLHADEPTEAAFVETKSLDGETNLKTKKPLKDISGRCSTLDAVMSLDANFVVEDPNLDLYRFDGKVSVGGQTLPLTNGEVIYRGSVLRNTPAALGLVIYSGEECKIRENANKNPRTKAPALQADVNRVVIFVAGLVFFMGIVLTPLYRVWQTTTERHSWYLEGGEVILGHVFTSFVIMFNTMLPLSLYVSLEIVKVIQMFQMNDIDMYDPETDTPMEPHTSTINEELGQVSYIFSDKTGTLTNNSMKFRKMSVAGSAWLHDFDLQAQALNGPDKPKLRHKKRGGKGKDKSAKPLASTRMSLGGISQRSGNPRASTPAPNWKPSARSAASLHCGKTEQLIEYIYERPNSVYAQKAKFFILALALCHTAMPEKDDEGEFDFTASSPDEVALVTAAKDLGYIMTDRQSETITIKTYSAGKENDPVYETYRILDVVEFSSIRKRMSIVVRLPDQKICLFTKGADTTVRSLLRLSDLVQASTGNVDRRASERRSLEAQYALRRRSTQTQSPGDARRSQSITLAGRNLAQRRSSSIAVGKGTTARQSVDLWLKDRESDVDMSVPRDSNSFYTPRQSLQQGTPRASGDPRQSLARAESTYSTGHNTELDALVDESVALNDHATFEHCFQHIDDFAVEGLRTLLYGYRFIPEEEYTEWRNVFAEASTSLVSRQEKMEAAGANIETRLELLGATAIEDKLQDGVPDAIDRLRRAGMKMWMLTGDKRETAINIGQSCRLIKAYSKVVVLDYVQGNLVNLMSATTADINSGQIAHSVLVVDGQTLTSMESDAVAKDAFTELAVLADSVICCRASPSQKATLVRTIRFRVKGSVTLAIGDGANDIAMIQEAHVGIGIAGKEGLQAARTSDYSIAQFRFLLKLLLVHGRWNYVRICKYTLGTFWKEMIFYLVQAMYQRWNGYTGTSLYEPWSLSMFNTLFTSLPVIFMGVFEQDMRPATLLAVPELYSIGPQRLGFNFKKYLYWATLGAVEAVIVYFMVYGIYGEAVIKRDNRVFSMGVLAFSACVTIINLKLQAIDLHNKTYMAVAAIVIEVGGWWLWNLILGATYDPLDPIYDVRGTIYNRWGRSLLFWLTLIVVVVAIVLLEIVLRTLWFAIKPGDTEIFQALEKDPEVRRRFEESAADLLQQGWDRGAKKSSQELVREDEEQAAREAQVQQLLERPRTMDTSVDTALSPGSDDLDQLDGAAKSARDISELFSKGFGKVKS